MSKLVRWVMAASLTALFVMPGLAAADARGVTVSLQSKKATRIPVSDLEPGYMTYYEGHPTVRGKFKVDATTIADALNDRGDKPIMIFVLDRVRAAANGCALRSDITFTAMINTPPVYGKQEVVFGASGGDGLGAMPLGVYHDMERRGCIAVLAGASDAVVDEAVLQNKKITKKKSGKKARKAAGTEH